MSRAQSVYDSFIHGLQTGQYRPGDRIRAEDLAQAFSVSRTPVREALSRLQERGLLEMTPSGLAVSQLSRQRVIELYAIRELLEGAAARLAAQHASPSDIYSMRHYAGEFEKAGDDPARAAHLNRVLHTQIYDAAHNRYLLEMLNNLHDTLMIVVGTTFEVEGRHAQAIVEHREILDAIERRDLDLADRLAREHITCARDARLKLMFDMKR